MGLENIKVLPSQVGNGLERSCVASEDRMVVCMPSGSTGSTSDSQPNAGVELLEARFQGNGFSPHRHDTYALGLTLHGVQTFSYRSERRFSQPGNVIVLHPDELHDGAAGTQAGLIYRMIYLPPQLIAAVNDHRLSLPFVADPVLADPLLWHALAAVLADLDRQPDTLLLDDPSHGLPKG